MSPLQIMANANPLQSPYSTAFFSKGGEASTEDFIKKQSGGDVSRGTPSPETRGVSSLKGYGEGDAGALRKDAIKSYDQVLKLDPKNEDAKYNKKLVEEELKKQKQQQQNKNNQNNKNKNQNQKQQRGKNKSDSGNSDQQKQNQQQQQQQSGNNDRQQADQGKNSSNQQQQQQDADKQDQGKSDKNKQQNAKPQDQPDNGKDDRQDQDTDKNMTASRERPPDEQEQATEQWLRRIPDDPAGLLRRKFLYQYRQRSEPTQPGEKTW